MTQTFDGTAGRAYADKTFWKDKFIFGFGFFLIITK